MKRWSCLCAGKPEATAIEVLEHFDLAKYFTRICGASFDHSRNHKSDVIAFLLQEIGNTSELLMVGDTTFDVTGAAVHLIPTIGVSWGYGEVDDMVSAGAASIAHTTEELFDLINA